MPINPGTFNRRITVYQQPGTSLDSFGQVNSATTAAFVVWARVAPQTASEPTQAEQLESIRQHKVTVRYSSDTARIRADWWFVDVDNSRKLSVVGSIDPEWNGELLEFACVEQVTT